MRPLLPVLFILSFCNANSQSNNFFNPHELIQKKIDLENKKRAELNSKQLWYKYKKPGLAGLYNRPMSLNKTATPGKMPAIIMQRPTIGIIPTIIERPVTLGIIPDMAINKKTLNSR